MRVLKLSFKEMGIRIMALILFLMLTSQSWATTYYVATTGNDGAAGTIIAPWRTIQKAANMVVAGDTVNIRGGVYSEYVTINPSGTAANRITFQSYSGEMAIVDGTSITPGTQSFLVRINGDYITLKNVEVRNAAWASVICWNTATQCIIDGNTIHDGYYPGIIFYQNAFNTAQNNHVYNMYDSATNGGQADCIVTSADTGTGGSHTYINNIVHDCGDDGIDGWASSGNTYIGNISYHNGWNYHNGTAAGDGNGFKLGGQSGTGNHTVIDNVAWNNRVRGFDDNTGVNNHLYNNTAINNASMNYRFTAAGAVLANNISYGALGTVTGGQTANTWNLGITNPLFVQITNPMLSTFARLQNSSAAINVGTTLTGSSHVCNGACDLGAYESGSTETIPPDRPTGLRVQ